jgi:hypothetical protein
MSNADTHARRGQYLNLPDQGTAALELQEVLSLPYLFVGVLSDLLAMQLTPRT